jgi:hypothetical protein
LYLALGGYDALCNDGAGVSRVVQRMHGMWLPVVSWTGSRP